MERLRADQSKRRSQSTRQRHRRGAPLGRQRDHLHLDGLPFQSERRVEDANRPEHFRELAGRTGRQTMTDFLHWMMTDGQKFCEPLAYAPLPKAVVAKEMKAISRIGG